MLPDIHRKVMYAKYVLEKAITMQTDSNEMSYSISLLLIHDAAELLMLTVLDHLKITPAKKRDFLDFWTEIKPPDYATPPDKIPLDKLNRLRVALKHSGAIPNSHEVKNLTPRVRGFFENVLKMYCGTEYRDISLLDLVPNAEVRSLLVSARTKFAEGDKAQAMTDLKIALHKMENPSDQYLPFIDAPAQPNVSGDFGLRRYLADLHAFLDQCASKINAMTIGIDPVKYAEFMKAGPGVLWSMTGQPFVSHWSVTYDHVTEERFSSFIDFLVDYALKASDVYIPRPLRSALSQ
ncbi:hypothetical protein [Occallatibacter riparius]|uniref:Uncharacterized protein n=1 Tax=Occallatibacter riparius TaxID=1002689 RepID=A0A9J7BM96_9BACT|nr:hypothetical protein [Occallatibacter riparius]UWZ83617.1 hypothetical protein MOP44_24000 [Occallatibacter riparius]